MIARGYEAAGIADGGTIQGRVVFTGVAPARKKLILTKDKEACGEGVREVDQILLTSDGAVQNAVVYLKHVTKGKAWEKPAKTPAIDNVKCDFNPRIQVIPAGDLAIVNSDPILHNTHGVLDRLTVFNVALPQQGQRITRPLRRPGMVRVACDAHAWMTGWIYVADNPYYATSGTDGVFTLSDVPPGSHTLVAWQEYVGAVEVAVTVRAREVATVTVELKK